MSSNTQNNEQDLAAKIMGTLHDVLKESKEQVVENKELEHKIKSLEDEKEELEEEIDKKDTSLRYVKNLCKNESVKYSLTKDISEIHKKNNQKNLSHYKELYTETTSIYYLVFMMLLLEIFVTYFYRGYTTYDIVVKLVMFSVYALSVNNVYTLNKDKTKAHNEKIDNMMLDVSEKQKEIDDMVRTEDFLGDVVDNA